MRDAGQIERLHQSVAGACVFEECTAEHRVVMARIGLPTDESFPTGPYIKAIIATLAQCIQSQEWIIPRVVYVAGGLFLRRSDDAVSYVQV